MSSHTTETQFDEKLARLASRLPTHKLSTLSHALKSHHGSVDNALEAIKTARSPSNAQASASKAGKKSTLSTPEGTLDGWVKGPSSPPLSRKKQKISHNHKVVDLISSDSEGEPEHAADHDHTSAVATCHSDPRSPPGPDVAGRQDSPVKLSINDVLKPQRQVPAQPPKESGPPPLLLGTPELVKQHAPCTCETNIGIFMNRRLRWPWHGTVIPNALPPELAMTCYLEMLQESVHWQYVALSGC